MMGEGGWFMVLSGMGGRAWNIVLSGVGGRMEAGYMVLSGVQEMGCEAGYMLLSGIARGGRFPLGGTFSPFPRGQNTCSPLPGEGSTSPPLIFRGGGQHIFLP